MSYCSEFAYYPKNVTEGKMSQGDDDSSPQQHAFSHGVKLTKIICMFRGILILTSRYKLQPVLSFRRKISRKSISEALGRYILLTRDQTKEWTHSSREMLVTVTLHESNHTGMYVKRKLSQLAQPGFSLCMIHCTVASIQKLSVTLLLSPHSYPPSQYGAKHHGWFVYCTFLFL